MELVLNVKHELQCVATKNDSIRITTKLFPTITNFGLSIHRLFSPVKPLHRAPDMRFQELIPASVETIDDCKKMFKILKVGMPFMQKAIAEYKEAINMQSQIIAAQLQQISQAIDNTATPRLVKRKIFAITNEAPHPVGIVADIPKTIFQRKFFKPETEPQNNGVDERELIQSIALVDLISNSSDEAEGDEQ